MKIKWSILSAILASLLLLAACGTKDAYEVNSGTSDVEESPAEEIEEDVEIDDDNVDEQVEADTEDESTEEAEPSSNEDGVEDDDAIDTPSAEAVDSDNQAFSINLLPNYELSGEEPGRDVVYTPEDDSHFMRIETMEIEEGNYEYLKDNMLVTLEASSEGETPVEATDEGSLPVGDSISNAITYSVNSENGPVTGILFETENLIVRLTIFDSANNDYFEDFLTMGETVRAK